MQWLTPTFYVVDWNSQHHENRNCCRLRGWLSWQIRGHRSNYDQLVWAKPIVRSPSQERWINRPTTNNPLRLHHHLHFSSPSVLPLTYTGWVCVAREREGERESLQQTRIEQEGDWCILQYNVDALRNPYNCRRWRAYPVVGQVTVQGSVSMCECGCLLQVPSREKTTTLAVMSDGY